MESTKFVATLIFISLAAAASGAQILCLVGVVPQSQEDWNGALFKALAERGHELTVVSATEIEGWSERINFISLGRKDYVPKSAQSGLAITLQPPSSFMGMLKWYESQLSACNETLASEGIHTAIELRGDEDFDVIITDVTRGPSCLLVLAQLFPNAPIVGISSFQVTPDLLATIGAGSINPALVPFFTADFSPKGMTYWQRFYNAALNIFAHFFRDYAIASVKSAVMSKSQPLLDARLPPTTDHLLERIKVALVNTHPSLDYPQPLPPNLIEVGGLHIEEPKALPEPLEEFMQSHEKGVIYMNLGSSTSYPNEFLNQDRVNSIASIVKRFPEYGFIWQMPKMETSGSQPKNLYLSEQLPQNDILGHANVKAFVMHAERLDMQEAFFYAVPVVGVPLYLDQFNNINLAAERWGSALRLDATTFSEATFEASLNAILSKPQYAQRAKDAQQAFKSRSQKPLDIAIWWVEQVAANPTGFAHLAPTTAGRFNILQELSLDLLALIILVAAAMTFNSYYILKQTVVGLRRTKSPRVKREKDEPKKIKSAKKVKKPKNE